MNKKEEKFVELAEIRVNRALHDLKLIGNLGNNRYQSTPQQRNKIITSIRKAVKEMEVSLNNNTEDKSRWKL